MTDRGRHISEEKRKAIFAMREAGVSSLVASKELTIPHRTVKLRYAKTMTPPTALKGLRLQVLQEVGRLLCWPAPKLAECLQRYIPNLHKVKIDLKGAKTPKKPKAIVTDRTIQRYLERCGLGGSTKKIWSKGTVAVHAINISWWQHSSEKKCVEQINADKKDEQLEKKTGLLLLIADRRFENAKDTSARDLFLRFALMPADKADCKNNTGIIISSLRRFHKELTEVHLVSGEQGKPTAVNSAEELQDLLQNVRVVVDGSTGIEGSIEIPASFPSTRSVENYLAIIQALKKGTPNFHDYEWVKVHKNITDEVFVTNTIGAFQPFLDR